MKNFKHQGVLAILYGPDKPMFQLMAIGIGMANTIRSACLCYLDEQSIRIDVTLN